MAYLSILFALVGLIYSIYDVITFGKILFA